MKKTLLKNYKILFMTLAFAFVSIFMLTTLIAPVSSMASAGTIYENTANYVTLDVTAYGANHQEIPFNESGSVTVKKGNDSTTKSYESYKWQDVKYLKVSIDSLSNIPDVASGESYSYSYSVDYYPLEISATNELDIATYAAKTVNPINDQTAEKKTDIEKNLYFFLDDNADSSKQIKQDSMTPYASGVELLDDQSLGYSYASQGGWGIYIFSFECQGITYSSVYEIVPTKLSELIEKSFTVIAQKGYEGQQSINGKYVFSVNEDFAYINRANIKWYINGVGSDGTTYVLCPEDKTQNENTIFKTNEVPRTGSSYVLDTSIQGKWKATAVITETGTQSRTAVSDEVSTIKPFSTTAIIWIVTGVTVIAVVIVSIVITVTIRKEKTW